MELIRQNVYAEGGGRRRRRRQYLWVYGICVGAGFVAQVESSSKSCRNMNDCSRDNEICIENKCVTLIDGVDGWIIGTIVLFIVIFILTILGICLLCPSCPPSRRFAHPLERKKWMEVAHGKKLDDNKTAVISISSAATINEDDDSQRKMTIETKFN